uniref:Uncharacterized protein n=1 Tax=Tanacetum cinerariifolium TaxID=118510 RepID=A0A699ISL4_TANCI|nr:hypothetical protein [Tanacetum cinerariifolium]
MVQRKEPANPTHVKDRYTGSGTVNIVNCWEWTDERHKGVLDHRNENMGHDLGNLDVLYAQREVGSGTVNIVNCWEWTDERHKGVLDHRNENMGHGLIETGTEGT